MNKILIIDDSAFTIHVLKDILKDTYEILEARNGMDGIQIAFKEIPSLILLDIEMPDMNGFQVLGILKEKESTKSIPVIFLTGITDSEYEERGFLSGAVDYIAKPYNRNIVKVRVNTHVELAEYRRQLELQLHIDLLTNICNRRGMDDYAEREWDRILEEGNILTCILLDIDFFKQVNDTYGHLEGDHVLQSLSKIFKKSVSDSVGCVARCGGEEFILILPNTTQEEGQKIVNKIFFYLEEAKIPNENSSVSKFLTISAGGISKVPGKKEIIKDYISKADEMLYKSKTSGRNRITWYGL